MYPTIQHTTITFIISAFLFVNNTIGFAMEVPIDDFPITAYSQNIPDYLSPNEKNYDQALLTPEYQQAQLKQFYNHYYSDQSQGLSPWSEHVITTLLPFVKKIEFEILDEFNNQNQSDFNKHYAENFKEHDQNWWNKIQENMNLLSLNTHEFSEQNRAITINNTLARALPDMAPDFFHASLPGQGFPFDNLQESSIWAGTPLYVLSLSKNKAWSLVLTPDGYFSWVKSNDIGYVSPEFIHQWQAAAKQGLIAITQTEASIMNAQQQFQLTGYIGAIFPMKRHTEQKNYILIPVKNAHHQAEIHTGIIDANASTTMPLDASPKNFVNIINQLIHRPYGWGGAFFFNDCSQEIKSIFTPFGIWLPRNSAQQAQLNATLDLSTYPLDQRIHLLKEKGHPLMTLIYIGGHVMLYIGHQDINGHTAAAITYQNIWGMAPKNRDKRYVIGQSLFFPLLKYYPENPDVSSLADKKIFKLVYLDELNLQQESPEHFTNRFLLHPMPDQAN